MALSVISLAPPPVKTTHVIYRAEHVWSVNLGYMAVTVTCPVPSAVKTKHAKYRMEHALHVSLDGPDCIVKQVRIFITHVINIRLTRSVSFVQI